MDDPFETVADLALALIDLAQAHLPDVRIRWWTA